MAEMISKWDVVNKLIALENEFQQYKPFEGFEHAMYRKVCEAEMEIGKTPGVEMVYCKDCKHWSYISGMDKEPHCTVFCGLHSKAYPTGPDDYCSKGERKDND